MARNKRTARKSIGKPPPRKQLFVKAVRTSSLSSGSIEESNQSGPRASILLKNPHQHTDLCFKDPDIHMLQVSSACTLNSLITAKREVKEIGEVERNSYDYAEFHWKIDNFSLTRASMEDASKYPDFLESPAFSFREDLWWIELFQNADNPLEPCFSLQRNLQRKSSIEYCVGLKNKIGRMMSAVNGIMAEDQACTGFTHLNVGKYIEYDTWHLIPDEKVTITCTLKFRHPDDVVFQADLMEIHPPRLIRLNKLSSNFKDLYTNKETCDVTLKVKDRHLRAHKSVLIARCDVFAATFKYDSLESQTGIINIPDCDPDSFQEFLEYLYCGKVEGVPVNNALDLFYISDKYDMPELKEFCIRFFTSSLTIENICKFAALSNTGERVELFSVVQEFFNKNYMEIFSTIEWDNLLKKDNRLASKLLKEMSEMKVKK